ncbi:MAG: biotin--[acetyl-CoA-carboxylase] ligase [Candidatus Eremiobacteraeota bacterium]|nr:biotin--[acetyl-CoA-carboxylase] ligase [Candidatus Eremiobacteraeota bacterium]
MPSRYDESRELLRATRFSQIRELDVVGSTNEIVARELGSNGARGLTVVADFQEHGSGRKGRVWVAPPGSALLFTTALPTPILARDLWIVPFWIALALRDALARHGVSVELQWPNDLLYAGRKLGGILCVSRVTGASAWVGCGVGVNVTRGGPLPIDPPPAFCSDASPVMREELLTTILLRFDALLDDLRSPQNIARRWEAAAAIPGTRYRLLVDGCSEPFEARAIRLATGGSLVVEQDGRTREISLADARVLREGG